MEMCTGLPPFSKQNTVVIRDAISIVQSIDRNTYSSFSNLGHAAENVFVRNTIWDVQSCVPVLVVVIVTILIHIGMSLVTIQMWLKSMTEIMSDCMMFYYLYVTYTLDRKCLEKRCAL